MSNETMPEKIYAGSVFVSDKTHGDWIDEEPTTYTSTEYTRTDTIPSRAEVAREFMDAVTNEMYQGIRVGGLILIMLKTIRKWEESDKCQ